jgi:hypothetical protein
MDSRSYVLKETGIIALGQALCIAVMLGVFVLLGRFDSTVLLGGLFGGLLSVANFFILAVSVSIASDNAVAQDVNGGKAVVQRASTLRLLVTVVILFALGKSGLCNIICLVLPLAFTRPILTLREFFRKSGDSKT